MIASLEQEASQSTPDSDAVLDFLAIFFGPQARSVHRSSIQYKPEFLVPEQDLLPKAFRATEEIQPSKVASETPEGQLAIILMEELNT